MAAFQTKYLPRLDLQCRDDRGQTNYELLKICFTVFDPDLVTLFASRFRIFDSIFPLFTL